MKHNFKYHSIQELEKLMDNLKEEIEHLKNTVERQNSTSAQKSVLDEDIDMLRMAEFEIMERSLLGKAADEN